MRKLWAVVIVTIVVTPFGSCIVDEHASKEESKLAAQEEEHVGKERRFIEPLPSKLSIDTGHAE